MLKMTVEEVGAGEESTDVTLYFCLRLSHCDSVTKKQVVAFLKLSGNHAYRGWIWRSLTNGVGVQRYQECLAF